VIACNDAGVWNNDGAVLDFKIAAGRLEIDLRYANDLSLRIEDNGVGIDPAFSEEGRPGHFGLQGMRERPHASAPN
jgi:glucose-6-phosphate-specific signal transduction histidine kinase